MAKTIDRDFVKTFLVKIKNLKTQGEPRVRLTANDVGNIREGIEDDKIVNFVYTRERDGKTGLYRGVEPYEVSGDVFWGFHKKHDSIHSFKLARMRGVKKTKVKFEKREFE